MKHNALTSKSVAATKKRGTYRDGGGLALQVSKWGTKSWVFSYTRDGKERFMGLGSINTLMLAEAREKARELRKQVLDGLDPITERDRQRQRASAEAASAISFKECAEKYIAAKQAGWRSEVHRSQWTSSLERYVYPVIGALPVADVNLPLVLKIIEPLWSERPETASRVRGRGEAVWDWAKVRGYCSGENPFRWRGHLQHLLPSRAKAQRVVHHAALPYQEIGAFMAELREHDTITARALEFTVLAAARISETLGAKWSEIDFGAKVWTVPPERTKAHREHKVPLTPRMLQILAELPRNGDRVFPITSSAVRLLMKSLRPDATTHGMRASFKTWATERTNYPTEAIELCLAHAVGTAVERAYQRGDLLDRRRKLIEEWSRYCGTPAQQTGGVVTLRA
jgi:integrase